MLTATLRQRIVGAISILAPLLNIRLNYLLLSLFRVAGIAVSTVIVAAQGSGYQA